MLDRLERRGHITRGGRPGDRRAVLVQLTSVRPAGRGNDPAGEITGLERRALGALPGAATAGLRPG